MSGQWQTCCQDTAKGQSGKHGGNAISFTVARFHFQSSKFKITSTFSYFMEIFYSFRCYYFGNSIEQEDSENQVESSFSVSAIVF